MWFDVIVTPLRDAAGAPTRLVSTARDVTEQHVAQQRLADSELRFRTLADTMPQIVFTATADGRPDYFNSGGTRSTGARAARAARRRRRRGERLPTVGDRFSTPPIVAAALTAWSTCGPAGGPVPGAVPLQARGRRLSLVHRAGAAAADDGSGRVARWIGTCTDVDDQKQADEERSQLLASERPRAPRPSGPRGSRTSSSSTLSHELRTPLNAMAGWIEVLQRDQRPDTLAKGLAVIDRNLKRQAQMIEQLLDMSRIVSGKMRLEVAARPLRRRDRRGRATRCSRRPT